MLNPFLPELVRAHAQELEASVAPTLRNRDGRRGSPRPRRQRSRMLTSLWCAFRLRVLGLLPVGQLARPARTGGCPDVTV